MSTINLNKLSIGFGSTCEQDTNTFTIQGDITIQATQGDGFFLKPFTVFVDKLTVVYNNDGLLGMVSKENPIVDVILDAEHYFVPQDIEYTPDCLKGYRLKTDGNSIELYGDFSILDESVY